MIRACPRCGRSDELWEGVELEGWRGVDAELVPSGDRGADWDGARPDGQAGCASCSWEGRRGQLVVLGTDGKPLREIDPNQLDIDGSDPDLVSPASATGREAAG